MTRHVPAPPLDPAARLRAIASTRAAFRACVTDPLHRTLRTARSGLDHAAMVYQIPLEAAAAGFQLTICQHDETGWQLTITRPVDDVAVFQAHAEATSLTACLVQLSEHGLSVLDQMDSNARAKPRAPKRKAAA